MRTLDVVRLRKDFAGMPPGTLGTIVLEYDGVLYEVEFVDADGRTLAVITTPADESIPKIV